MSSRTARRTATITAALTTALVLALGPTAAHAAGWGEIASRNHSSVKVKKGDATYGLRMDFKAVAKTKYRVCVTVKGKATFQLYPTGVMHSINTTSFVKKCNTFTQGSNGATYGPYVWVQSGEITISRSSVERYYTGAVPY